MSRPDVAWPSVRRPGATTAAAGTGATAVVAAGLLDPAVGLHVTTAVSMVGALLCTGVAIFGTTAAPAATAGPLRELVLRATPVAGAATLLTLPFAVMTVAGTGVGGVADGTAVADVLTGGDYESALARLAGLVLVTLGGPTRRRRQVLAVAGAALVAGSFLLTGHARTHDPTALMLCCTGAHVLAAATWFGGLAGLAITLRQPLPAVETARTLAGFARAMTFVLATLVAAGVGLAVFCLPSAGALVHTAYGQVLLVKLAILLGALVVSAANHVRLVPLARTGHPRAVQVLRVNVSVEQCALLAVLAVTEILVRQSPGG